MENIFEMELRSMSNTKGGVAMTPRTTSTLNDKVSWNHIRDLLSQNADKQSN